MKRILFFLIFIFIAFTCFGQDLDETIDYINNKLKRYDHTSFIIKQTNLEFMPDWDISSYYKWELLSSGELVIRRIIIDEGKKEFGSEKRLFVKNLSDNIELVESKDYFGYNYYKITLRCKKYGCIVTQYTDDYTSQIHSSFYITLTDKTYSERVINAIKKLIELVNESDRFLEDDPFK